ncbi:MAG: hypothetical protein BAJALOKI1v1_260011 [Promethearchaeota archaeon]|nr:MAG: hypothetical protein BAJALOKI1v1_260011 [Candidatus Lokiarchaeota archaeon]
MFGCPCYRVDKKFFTFLMIEGIVFTKLNKHQKSELKKIYATRTFRTEKSTITKWIKVSLKNLNGFIPIYKFLRQSYKNTRKENSNFG